LPVPGTGLTEESENEKNEVVKDIAEICDGGKAENPE